jgi:isopentenyl phosphate kinase
MRRFLPQLYYLTTWAVLLFAHVTTPYVRACAQDEDGIEVVLVKIGGSSITNKAEKESINEDSLNWFAKTVSSAVLDRYRAPSSPDDVDCESTAYHTSEKKAAFVIIHGAGSFGHFQAKEYGLKGQSEKPNNNPTTKLLSEEQERYRKRGLSETRLSVQTLNRHVVSTFLDHGLNAVGISPCFGIPGLEAHANQQTDPLLALETVVKRTVDAGLIPVLHGDACLYGDDAGILSGDTLMEVLATASWIKDVIFITDVDGVFSEDPRENPEAQLLRHILVDPRTGSITTELTASSSSHDHDVTGGLAVSEF